MKTLAAHVELHRKQDGFGVPHFRSLGRLTLLAARLGSRVREHSFLSSSSASSSSSCTPTYVASSPPTLRQQYSFPDSRFLLGNSFDLSNSQQQKPQPSRRRLLRFGHSGRSVSWQAEDHKYTDIQDIILEYQLFREFCRPTDSFELLHRNYDILEVSNLCFLFSNFIFKEIV